jgi:acyl carrier protein
MKHNEIEQIVCEVFSIVLGLKVNPGDIIERKSVSQWDSLKHVELIFVIEEKVNVRFSPSDLANLDSLTKIIAKAKKYHET